MLSGRAQATFLVEQTGACGRLDDSVCLCSALAQAVGGSSTSGERQGCATHSLSFFLLSRGDGPVNWRGERKTVQSRDEMVSSRTHEALLRRRAFRSLGVEGHRGTPGCTDLVKPPLSVHWLVPKSAPAMAHVRLLRIIGQPDDLPATSVHVFAGLRLVRPGISALHSMDMHGSLGARQPRALDAPRANTASTSFISPRPLTALRLGMPSRKSGVDRRALKRAAIAASGIPWSLSSVGKLPAPCHFGGLRTWMSGETAGRHSLASPRLGQDRGPKMEAIPGHCLKCYVPVALFCPVRSSCLKGLQCVFRESQL